MGNDNRNLAVLLLISILLSIYLYSRTYVISHDGAFQYIPIARDFVSGLYGKALGHNQQPLYSFFVAFVYGRVGDFELAGKLVSTVFGILLIFPVYFLGKGIFDKKIAFLSALLLAFHPYIRRFSADVLKESMYLFFLATAIWFSWRVIQSEKKYLYLYIPFFSALAYLVRPDGVEVILLAFFYVLFLKKFDSTAKKWVPVSLLFLSSLLLFLPYLIHLRESTGTWTLSRDKGMLELLGLGMLKGEVSFMEKILFSLKELNLEIFSVYHPLYLILFTVGLFKRASSHFNHGEKFLISFILVHYFVLFLLALNFTDWTAQEEERYIAFSGRHVLPLLLFSIYWIGEGLAAVFDWTHHKIESHGFLPSWEASRKSMAVWTILFILAAATVLPKTLKPQRYERLPEKWAGRWIRDQYGQGATILTTKPRVAFYADGQYEYIDLTEGNMGKIQHSIIGSKALFLVLRDTEIHFFSQETFRTNFIELKRFEGEGMETVIIFRKAK